jgi:phosphocarrier protein
MRYENRTIHIEKEPDYSRLIDIMQSYKTVDFVAGYKRYLFEPLDSKMWEIHKPGGDTRIVFYAWDFKHKGKLKTSNELDSIGEIAEVFGSLATTKRKRYNQYAKRIYRINDKSGLHARPSASFVTLASKYPADIWLRTDSKEVNGKSILGVMTLAATADKPLTVLYKPREKSEEFYNSLESIELNEGKLFTRID